MVYNSSITTIVKRRPVMKKKNWDKICKIMTIVFFIVAITRSNYDIVIFIFGFLTLIAQLISEFTKDK